MALEQLDDNQWQFTPGCFDVHAHPRVFDAMTEDSFVPINGGTEGKAGLRTYTETALRSGIVGMIAMPNEARRFYDLESSELTSVKQTPIADLALVEKMQDFISQQAYIPTAIHFGIDPETAFIDSRRTKLDDEKLSGLFASVKDECTSLKVYLAETTGGNNVAVEHGAEVVRLWHQYNPEKPVVFHVEGPNVSRLLADIAKAGGKHHPIHIAHVSSREELTAVIAAKQAGMNITCEVTPHHLFLDETVRTEIGGYGCMKPSLKPQEDINFLWANMKNIDIFASDCAPHRRSDKEGENPAYGVTNHTVMLPLLLGAVEDGRLAMDDIYQKLCVNPRQRFNLPLDDDSYTRVTTQAWLGIENYERPMSTTNMIYGHNPFARLERRFHLVGAVAAARAGYSTGGRLVQEEMVSSYTHLIRPKNLALQHSNRE